MLKKKILAIVLASVLVLLTVCAGGGVKENDNEGIKVFGDTEAKDPLVICVDLVYLGIENLDPSYNFESAVEGAVQGLVLEIAERGGPQDIEIEVIPKEEAARKSALTRIRTEIMSGEGPDVFIMGCSGGTLGYTGDALFPIPEKAMENALFLPLDEYMESNTQFAEWDKMQATVIAAGRNEDGQQIIPISYTMPITFYRAAEVTEKPDGDTTWNDMLQDETGVLSTAATWEHMSDGLVHMRGNYIEYTFGQLADYEAEKLTFTEEELLQRIIEINDVGVQYESGGMEDVPVHYQTCLSVDYNNETGTNPHFAFASDDPFGGIKPSDAQTMIPIYCDDGGATATILSYAAINANTRRPEDAFYILDVLMDRKTQQTSILYENWFTQVYGIPMHTDLLQPRYPVMYPNIKTWYLGEENYAEISRVRDQITFARFRSGLDVELNEAYYAYVDAVRRDKKTDEELNEIIAECYQRMERLLGE